MPERPGVTVVLPLYNGADHVEAALDSVLAQHGWEPSIVVVDDGSADDGPAMVARRAGDDPRISLIRLGANHGVAHARNVGVAAGDEPLVAMIDQDDTWRPGRLDAGWAALSADPGVAFAVGHQSFVPPSGPLPAWVRPRWLEGPQSGYVFGTMLAWRAAGWDRVGPLRTDLIGGTDDVDWFARAADLGVRHAVVPDVLLDRRIHGGNASARTGRSIPELLAIVRGSVHRRDALGAPHDPSGGGA